MSLVEIEWHPTGRQLRVFGVSGLLASIVAAVVLLLVWGVVLFWALLVLATGAAIFLCSFVSPRAARILYIGLTLVAMPIGMVVSLVLLAGFYFLLLAPLAIVFRLMGRDPLHRRFDPTAESYWVPHRPSETMERYFHQF